MFYCFRQTQGSMYIILINQYENRDIIRDGNKVVLEAI